MQDWLTASAATLGRGIAAGEIDPVDLTEAYLEAAAQHSLRDRIYTMLTPQRARAEAQAAARRAKQGQRLSALDGVPVSWKDLFDTAGLPTEAGSDLLAGRVPDRDAHVLQVATAMGTVCLGKTHMSELAFTGLGLNPVKETPPCVNDPGAVAGGSSSGAAASVAHNLAPLAIGSDTGGSVRIPSVWNDLVGLKTTAGRLSLEGAVPLCLSFDTVGPLARSVEDAALALGVLEGRQGPDLRGASLRGSTCAILKTVALDDVEDQPMAAFERAVARLQAAGMTIVELEEAPEVTEAMALSAPLFAGEAYGLWKDKIEANPDVMYDRVRERFRGGAAFDAVDFVDGWQRLKVLREKWLARTAGYDAVLLPTAALMPPQIAQLEKDEDHYVERNIKALRNTRIGNLMGACALTIPTGTPSCGIMFMSGPLQEERLLRLGDAAQKALV